MWVVSRADEPDSTRVTPGPVGSTSTTTSAPPAGGDEQPARSCGAGDPDLATRHPPVVVRRRGAVAQAPADLAQGRRQQHPPGGDPGQQQAAAGRRCRAWPGSARRSTSVSQTGRCRARAPVSCRSTADASGAQALPAVLLRHREAQEPCRGQGVPVAVTVERLGSDAACRLERLRRLDRVVVGRLQVRTRAPRASSPRPSETITCSSLARPPLRAAGELGREGVRRACRRRASTRGTR